MAPLSRENSSAEAVMPLPGPAPLEIVFSFDTTGSMSGCIAEVRAKVQEIMERLSSDIPALRMAVFAHGDYCDTSTYVTKWLDFTTNVNDLCDFVKNVGGTGGGDFPECYELVLRQVREELSWTSGTQRSLVMIGDAIPHEPSYIKNKLKIDWKEEVEKLHKDMGVQIYSVQCNTNEQATKFFGSMAKVTNGKHLQLDNFSTIVDMMMSIIYREHGVEYFEAYEKEVRDREGAGIRWELERMFKTLGDGDAATTSGGAPVATILPVAAVTAFPATPIKRRPATVTLKRGQAEAARKLFTTPLKGVKAGGVTKKTAATAKKVAKKTMRNLTAATKATTTTRRILRENVTDRHLLQHLNWSSWKEAFRCTLPTRCGSNTWKPRRTEQGGFRCVSTFDDATAKQAMYELSVQMPDSREKVTVWSGFTDHGFQHQNWDTHFLRNKNIQDSIDGVLGGGARLFVRRATSLKEAGLFVHAGKVYSNMDELRKLVRKTYDYAWAGKTSPRQLFLRRSARSAVLARKGVSY